MSGEREAVLLPCPFCGSEPLIEDGENDRPWVVQCIMPLCFAQPFMDHADTKRQAIAAWNTRIPTLAESVRVRPDADPRDVANAAGELAALANLIQRSPLDDVLLTQEVALRSAAAIRTILAALPSRAQIEAEERERCVAAARDALVNYEWPPQDGDAQCDAVLAAIRAQEPRT